MSAFAAAAATLQAQAARPLSWRPRFDPLPAGGGGAGAPDAHASPAAQAPVVAVDGSHTVLADNGAVWVVAHRSVALRWPGPATPVPPVVLAATPEEAERLAGRPVGSAEAFAAALRARAEARLLRDAVAAAPAGSLVLADGALRGLPPEEQDAADAAAALARERDVHLAGVAKRSALARDGVPLVAALHAAGPPGAWSVAVAEGTYVARLHAAAPCAFRVDCAGPAVLERLLPLCRDAAYPGYPYPLAKAHNQVAFTAGAAAELRAGLERELRRAGGPRALRLLADFHDVLDRNVAA